MALFDGKPLYHNAAKTSELHSGSCGIFAAVTREAAGTESRLLSRLAVKFATLMLLPYPFLKTGDTQPILVYCT